MKRRLLLQGMAAMAGMQAVPSFAQAGFPVKPVRLVIPFTPGGSTDILGRAIAIALSDAWKQSVVAENRPGAGGAIGADAVAKSAPDGYTLLMGHIGTLAVNPNLYAKLPYNPMTDFSTIAMVGLVPNVLVVNNNLPVKNVADLVALAKAKPGSLNYASGGIGSAAHLAMEYFKLATGTDIVHVPYKGTAPALTDLIGGQVSVAMTGLPPVFPHLRGGKLRALGVASNARLEQIPDVPTIASSGVPGFETTQWYGVVGPAKMSPQLVDQIGGEIRRSLARPDLKKRLEDEGALPSNMGPVEFRNMIGSEIERWGKVIRAAKIQPE
jgi:tripartite-type tricarboxylate transporter receptor subunit TctC